MLSNILGLLSLCKIRILIRLWELNEIRHLKRIVSLSKHYLWLFWDHHYSYWTSRAALGWPLECNVYHSLSNTGCLLESKTAPLLTHVDDSSVLGEQLYLLPDSLWEVCGTVFRRSWHGSLAWESYTHSCFTAVLWNLGSGCCRIKSWAQEPEEILTAFWTQLLVLSKSILSNESLRRWDFCGNMMASR